MDEFSYLSVLLSIIIGLAIAQLLQGLAGVIQARRRVRIYWPALVWACLLLLIAVQMWWSSFGLRNRRDWTFLAFSVVILQMILLFVLASLVLPSFTGDAPIDLQENYFGHARWFFGCFTAVYIVSLLKDVVLSGSLPNPLNLGFHLFGIGSTAVAAVTRNEPFHRFFAILSAVLFAGYVAVLFARMPQ